MEGFVSNDHLAAASRKGIATVLETKFLQKKTILLF